MGITPDTTLRPEKPSLKRVGLAILATIRMRRGAEAWAKSRKIHDRLAGKVKEMRRSSSAQPSSDSHNNRSYLSTPRRVTSSTQPRSEGRDRGRNVSMSGGLGRKSLQDTLASVANAKRVAELRGEGRRGF